jgi:hypothetical protein
MSGSLRKILRQVLTLISETPSRCPQVTSLLYVICQNVVNKLPLCTDGLTAFVSSIPLLSTGSITVLTRVSVTSDWVPMQTLMASNGAAGDQFGYSSAITLNSYNNMNIAIVGANTNSAYISYVLLSNL